MLVYLTYVILYLVQNVCERGRISASSRNNTTQIWIPRVECNALFIHYS